MSALIRYHFATMQHSQRYVAPVLLFMGTVGALSSNDAGSLAPVYAMLQSMGAATEPAELLAPVSRFLAIALGLLAVSTIATQYLTTRRD